MVDVIHQRKYYFAISGIVMLASLIALSLFGLKPNIDFTGGSLMEVAFTGERPDTTQIASLITPILGSEATIQPTGDNGFLIKMRFVNEEEHQTILKTIRDTFQTNNDQPILEKRIETIGPSIS